MKNRLASDIIGRRRKWSQIGLALTQAIICTIMDVVEFLRTRYCARMLIDVWNATSGYEQYFGITKRG
eukprot:3292407-Karenia_brevis.AAC.1